MEYWIYLLILAGSTYLIRAIPFVLVRKRIENRFLRSFLHYIPVACLTAMTFPAILYATDHILSGIVGLAVAVLLAFKNKSLIVVAASSCAAVFILEQIVTFLT